MSDERVTDGREAGDAAATKIGPVGLRGLAASPLFRLLAINWLIGAFAAVLVLSGLLWFDTGGLRSLIVNSPEPWLPILVLLFGLMVTLCSAAMGAAVMSLPESDDGAGKGRGRRLFARSSEAFAPELVPVRVPVRAEGRPRR
jgi:hypothetical protein